MKKLSTFIIAVMCSLIFCSGLYVFANEPEDFDYDIDENGGIIITGCSAGGDIEIPEQIDGTDVVSLHQ